MVLVGTREQKAEDFTNMFLDKEVKAIICLEGGENCNTFIDLLDYGEKRVIREGNTSGIAIGTNLASMMYLVGTEFLPDMQDKIIFIESLRSSPNECQRRFAHLKQFGIFDKIKGIVIGYNYDLQKDGDIYPQMEDILMEYTKEYSFPIIKCNDFGHEITNCIIPIGCETCINSIDKQVNIVEEFLK